MRTYKDVLEDGIQLLETAAIEEARLDAWLLLEYTADITRAWYQHKNKMQEYTDDLYQKKETCPTSFVLSGACQDIFHSKWKSMFHTVDAFYFCAGTGLLGSPVWASSDGSNRVRRFF